MSWGVFHTPLIPSQQGSYRLVSNIYCVVKLNCIPTGSPILCFQHWSSSTEVALLCPEDTRKPLGVSSREGVFYKAVAPATDLCMSAPGIVPAQMSLCKKMMRSSGSGNSPHSSSKTYYGHRTLLLQQPLLHGSPWCLYWILQDVTWSKHLGEQGREGHQGLAMVPWTITTLTLGTAVHSLGSRGLRRNKLPSPLTFLAHNTKYCKEIHPRVSIKTLEKQLLDK